MPEGYEEAQRANREWRERNDAKLKLWGRMEDELEARKGHDQSQGGKNKSRIGKQERQADAKAQGKVLEGQDFLDSVLA